MNKIQVNVRQRKLIIFVIKAESRQLTFSIISGQHILLLNNLCIKIIYHGI